MHCVTSTQYTYIHCTSTHYHSRYSETVTHTHMRSLVVSYFQGPSLLYCCLSTLRAAVLE